MVHLPTSPNKSLQRARLRAPLSSKPLGGMQIRRAGTEDAEAISQLIRGLARYFTLDPQGHGAEAFLKSIEPSAIKGYISASNFSYFIGHVESQLAGVVAVRDNTHLYHLFVGQEFQGQGLSSQLWQHAKTSAAAAGNRVAFTVNSTPYAVPVYERFGFKASGPRVETNGIAYVPMRLDLEASNAL